MRRYAATLAYDGSAYCGFQRQAGATPTIQLTVEQAIERVTGDRVSLTAAGRTDAGVHARGQVIAFDTAWRHSSEELWRAINARLPADIALQDLWRQDGFHPRFDALWREYRYRVMTPPVRSPLLRGQVWQLLGRRLDAALLNASAQICLGEQDFAAFGTAPQAGSVNTVREVFVSRWELLETEYGTVYRYRVRATAFLNHMVRRMVGAMTQVGGGQMTLADFERILLSRDLSQAKVIAPAQGLVLEKVKYPPREEKRQRATESSLASLSAWLE